jgi:hypothetical protein
MWKLSQRRLFGPIRFKKWLNFGEFKVPGSDFVDNCLDALGSYPRPILNNALFDHSEGRPCREQRPTCGQEPIIYLCEPRLAEAFSIPEPLESDSRHTGASQLFATTLASLLDSIEQEHSCLTLIDKVLHLTSSCTIFVLFMFH